MNNFQFAVVAILLVAVIGGIGYIAFRPDPPPPYIPPENGETKKHITEGIICPKGLDTTICPNPSGMHGQIMVHNMTDRSFDVKVEHHNGKLMEEMHIQPGDGWSFTNILQGKRLLYCVGTVSGRTYESNCMVIGGTMHMMNITNSGFEMVDTRAHTGHDTAMGMS